MRQQSTTADIVIVGDGIVGLTLAFWLAQDGFRVLQFCRENPVAPPTPVALALGPCARQTFKVANLWQTLPAGRPFFAIEVFDADGEKLRFDSRDIYQPALGWVIPQHELVNSLRQTLATTTNVVQTHQQINSVNTQTGDLLLADGDIVTASIIIAADGAGSVIRDMTGITTARHDYSQSAVVCTVKNPGVPFGIARQWFLKQGPLALLPLPRQGTECLIWSVPKDEADRLVGLDRQQFNLLLTTATGNKLELTGERSLYPLHRLNTATYNCGRIMLIGDSAHQLHPLAGMGANMGLMDAAGLHKLLLQQRDRGAALHSVGAAFNRRRRAHNTTMMTAIDFIHAMYSARSTAGRRLRATAIRNIHNCLPGRKLFMRYATGQSGAGSHQWYTAGF